MTKASKMEEDKRYTLISELSDVDDCRGRSGEICVFFGWAIGVCSYTKCVDNNVIYLLKDEKCV